MRTRQKVAEIDTRIVDDAGILGLFFRMSSVGTRTRTLFGWHSECFAERMKFDWRGSSNVYNKIGNLLWFSTRKKEASKIEQQWREEKMKVYDSHSIYVLTVSALLYRSCC